MDADEHPPEGLNSENIKDSRQSAGVPNEAAPPLTAGSRSQLTINERMTLFVGFGSLFLGASSLVVSFLTYKNAADTRDIKQAVRGLAILAEETKRQADQTKRQADGFEKQLGFLRQQVDEAKAQTNAISAQTDAIKSSSVAAVKSAGAQIASAEAQKNMANVTAQAQRPDIDLSELSVDGLASQPDQNGNVAFTLFWRFRNTGGSALTVKRVRWGLYIADRLPDQMPALNDFNGLDIVVTPTITSAFSPARPIQLGVKREVRDGIGRGNVNIFFYSVFEYKDGLGAEHQKCFGRQIIFKDGEGSSSFSVPIGGKAYHCNS